MMAITEQPLKLKFRKVCAHVGFVQFQSVACHTTDCRLRGQSSWRTSARRAAGTALQPAPVLSTGVAVRVARYHAGMAETVERSSKPHFFDIDFEKAPFIAIWEITRACDLRCVHCRAEAIPQRDADELTREQGFKLIEELRAFSDTAPPLFVITGGDPLKSPHVYDYIKHADQVGLRV